MQINCYQLFAKGHTERKEVPLCPPVINALLINPVINALCY